MVEFGSYQHEGERHETIWWNVLQEAALGTGMARRWRAGRKAGWESARSASDVPRVSEIKSPRLIQKGIGSGAPLHARIWIGRGGGLERC